MKKFIILSAILLTFSFAASAQYYGNSNNNMNQNFRLGIGVSSGFSVGPVSGAFPGAGSISVTGEFPLGQSPVRFLLSTGVTFYVSNSGYDVGYYGDGFGGGYYGDGAIATFVPVEAGLKIYVAPRVFLEGLAGASFNVNTYTSDYTGQGTAFVYQPSIGYSFQSGWSRRSTFDLSLMYENRPEPGGGYQQVAIKGVFNFGL